MTPYCLRLHGAERIRYFNSDEAALRVFNRWVRMFSERMLNTHANTKELFFAAFTDEGTVCWRLSFARPGVQTWKGAVRLTLRSRAKLV